MKVKVSLELELPEIVDESVDLNQKYTENYTVGEALLVQNVFDNLTNYALISHLQDSIKWLIKSKENKQSMEYHIYSEHNKWADILQRAMPTVKTEIIRESP